MSVLLGLPRSIGAATGMITNLGNELVERGLALGPVSERLHFDSASRFELGTHEHDPRRAGIAGRLELFAECLLAQRVFRGGTGFSQRGCNANRLQSVFG